jgi:hypothetical protein
MAVYNSDMPMRNIQIRGKNPEGTERWKFFRQICDHCMEEYHVQLNYCPGKKVDPEEVVKNPALSCKFFEIYGWFPEEAL